MSASVHDRIEAFWQRVDRRGDDECWEWTGAKTSAGYGVLSLGKTAKMRAHRAAYTLLVGPITPGMLVCHSCDNPPCCNPAHLWLGTDADNNKDRASKGRTVRVKRNEDKVPHKRGEDHWCSKMSVGQVQAIRCDDRPLADIAAEYGINITTASRIRRGVTWKSVPLAALIAQEEG